MRAVCAGGEKGFYDVGVFRNRRNTVSVDAATGIKRGAAAMTWHSRCGGCAEYPGCGVDGPAPDELVHVGIVGPLVNARGEDVVDVAQVGNRKLRHNIRCEDQFRKTCRLRGNQRSGKEPSDYRQGGPIQRPVLKYSDRMERRPNNEHADVTRRDRNRGCGILKIPIALAFSKTLPAGYPLGAHSLALPFAKLLKRAESSIAAEFNVSRKRDGDRRGTVMTAYWFRPQRNGDGGLTPTTWQGWAVTLGIPLKWSPLYFGGGHGGSGLVDDGDSSSHRRARVGRAHHRCQRKTEGEWRWRLGRSWVRKKDTDRSF